MSDPTESPAPLPVDPIAHAMRELLMESALCIASFRWKLRAAGYPFKEPPNVQRIIAEIDNLVFPLEQNVKQNSGKQRSAA